MERFGRYFGNIAIGFASGVTFVACLLVIGLGITDIVKFGAGLYAGDKQLVRYETAPTNIIVEPQGNQGGLNSSLEPNSNSDGYDDGQPFSPDRSSETNRLCEKMTPCILQALVLGEVVPFQGTINPGGHVTITGCGTPPQKSVKKAKRKHHRYARR